MKNPQFFFIIKQKQEKIIAKLKYDENRTKKLIKYTHQRIDVYLYCKTLIQANVTIKKYIKQKRSL